MKRTRRCLAWLLAALLTLTISGCGNSSGSKEVETPAGDSNRESSTASQTNPDDFQKNLHQTIRRLGGYPSFLETDTGYYMGYGWLYYVEKDTGKASMVCGKPDCDHTDRDVCDAIIEEITLLTIGDRIYYAGADNDPREVKSVKLDGTEHQVVQELKFMETSSAQSSYDLPIYHRGYLYYVSDDILYRVKLGGAKDSAEALWSPADAGSTQSQGNLVDYSPNAIRYTLWADGDKLYFMANVQTTDGTYTDVLFQCGLDGSDVHQVWVTPSAEEVGEWETAGVSVSQWYVTGDYIYFYLSGGDLWRTELSSGKTEKLADTHEKTQYGSAVFTDRCMCLLNDEPVDNYADRTLKPGSRRRSNGDTIFVYGIDGTFQREISLNPLFQELGDVAYIDLLLCDDTDVYFLATSMTYSGEPGMSVGSTGAITLCRANLETGEAMQVYRLR